MTHFQLVCDFVKSKVALFEGEEKEELELALQCLEQAFKVKAQDSNQLETILNEYSSGSKSKADEYKQKGNELFQQNDFEGALVSYSKAIEIYPSAVYYSNRAGALSKLQRHEEAAEDAKKALELDPNFTKAQTRLDHALNQMKPNDMMQKAQDMLAKNPQLAQMAKNMDPNMISSLMNNPAMRQMAEQAMSDPNFLNFLNK